MKQKNIITVVTDHQLTADTIAKALGANSKCDGYYTGNGYAVTWTGGELVEATFSPDERFVLSTTLNPRHIFAHNFKFSMRNYDELLGWNKSEQDSRQLTTITSLINMSKLVVNAMSPDLYGETCFLSLYYFIGNPIAVRRAWLPILTRQAIVKGIENGPKYPEKYEEWLKSEMYNLIAEKSKETTKIPEPIFVETPVDRIPDEVTALGIAEVKPETATSSKPTPPTAAIRANGTKASTPAVSPNWLHCMFPKFRPTKMIRYLFCGSFVIFSVIIC
ncbi:MAG: hypothetical protein HDS18_07295 [Bacteroides sp.]|nr:hypothetical protein [Bacteroides sp.]